VLLVFAFNELFQALRLNRYRLLDRKFLN